MGVMPGHQHHEHSGDDLAAAAQQALTRAGEQWTDLRADVFAALATHATPASAYDIADEVSARRGKRMAPNSEQCLARSGSCAWPITNRGTFQRRTA